MSPRASGQDRSAPLVVLLARGIREYRTAVRSHLAAAGFDDLPRSAAWLLTSLEPSPGTLGGLAAGLGTSKQSLSRLSETLVERGYLSREMDRGDRRRVRLDLTARGRAAAALVAAAVKEVDSVITARDGGASWDCAIRALRRLFDDPQLPRPGAAPATPGAAGRASQEADPPRSGSQRSRRGPPGRSGLGSAPGPDRGSWRR